MVEVVGAFLRPRSFLHLQVGGEGEQQVGHGLGHLHHGRVEEGALKAVRPLAPGEPRGQRHRRRVVGEALAQVVREPGAAVQVAQPGALQGTDHVVGVAGDQVPDLARAGGAEDHLVVDLGPHRHHQVAHPDVPSPSGG
ncbi:hypothetical protein ACFV2H_50370 [Streptomyces sp. NPDC059629]|uniref:hypothetical protein n=1 Tax=Streptomyces sp. NPDC059629 TaxID=3346889 RepID=UPI00368D989B